MKNLVLYFSATGNTERAIGIVAAELERAGQTVKRFRIRAKAEPPSDLGGFDRIIVAFPVLAMAAPPMVARFLKRLPPGRRDGRAPVKAAVLAVAGGEGGPAAIRAAARLAKKGYDVELSVKLDYAPNWVEVGEVPKDEDEAARRNALGDEEARCVAADLLAGRRRRDGTGAGTALLGRALAFLFGVFGRRFLGKLFVADERCVACGLCARTCPAGTIMLGKGKRARPFWRMNCENCNRCMNVCPKEAINLSMLNAVVAFASIGTVMALGLSAFGSSAWPAIRPCVPAAFRPAVHAVAVIAVVIAAHFIAIGPVDYFLFRWLRRVPGLRSAFALSPSRGFRRYRAPGFKPGEGGN